MATTTRKKTDDVLAAARKDLQAQLAVVRDEISRLVGEEHVLSQALSSLDGDGASSSTAVPRTEKGGGGRAARRSTRTSSAGKVGASGRRRRGKSKSTAERVNELRGLLADGPKSRNDLAAALKVSPARVQQLLAEAGDEVSSQPDPGQRQGKLWTIAGRGNGASGGKPTGKPKGEEGKATRKPKARRKQAAS